MPDSIADYVGNIQREFATGHAQEHSYRPALKSLFEETTKLEVVNEPKGSAHGRPDLIFVKGEIPVAWVEAKDLHINLDKVEKSEQMARYFGYANLILTNGLEFRFFKNGKRYGDSIILATKIGDKIEGRKDTYKPFERLIVGFIQSPAETIRSAKHLAQIMGGKAALLRDNITHLLHIDAKCPEIVKIRDILKMKLIHDLSDKQFADIYAQTLVYGLFVARYHDDSPETFSRSEAREKIPASNHLLQQFFDHIAGANFEKELSFIVDELCEVFRYSRVRELVHGIYLKNGDTHDPIIHFYEDFLREYDPELRTERGVFYTPLPVVRYIVRSVDALLKSHFGLEEGLADRSSVEYSVMQQGKKVKRTCDRVQILDPAVGTGTFLDQVIRHIHGTFKGQEGSWPKFVDEHLLGRLNGFELMMASYTIAHLKLSMTLAETGVKETRKRLRVFLTNSLEQAKEEEASIFNYGLSQAITDEAIAADEIKKDLPIMVVLGNPPYSGEGNNKGLLDTLMESYKVEPGGKEKLKEKNSKWINDDYVKFIRFAESLIEKNGEGIVAMITNHGYLDNPTFRGMRWHLLKTFNDVYILDLHGNTKKHETDSDGSKDENVFDIQQGVSILIAVRKKDKKGLGEISRFDIYGKRDKKYEWLDKNDLKSTPWNSIECLEPLCLFKHQDVIMQNEYKKANKITNLFPINGTGIVTKRDELVIHHSPNEALQSANDLLHLSESEVRHKYHLPSDVRDWRYEWAQKDVREHGIENSFIRSITYRPFDRRYLYYTGRSRGFMGWPVLKIMCHMLAGENIGLISVSRVPNSKEAPYIFASNNLVINGSIRSDSVSIDSLFPLYLYPSSSTLSGEKRTANLDMALLAPVLKNLKLEWIPDGTGDGKKTCGPEDIFDYVYAVLHCPAYRSRYKEFLKIDFPRVPFTSDATLFWKLVALGREVRGLHLLESPELKKLRTSYPMSGSDMVEKIRFEGEEKGKVWINATQYFGEVPKIAWEFFIGGYQPAQKWLKDRKGRTLTSDDILHYQRVIIALCETDNLMKEIDEMIEKSGGLPLS